MAPRTPSKKALEEAHALCQQLGAAVDRARTDFDSVAERQGLTPLQAQTVLALDEPTAMRDLAERMSCHASNITGLADRLERAGVIERVPGADRRVKLLSLTDQGRRLHDELVELASAAAMVNTRLTRAERQQLGALLDKILVD